MTISLSTDAVNFGAYLQPFPNYPGVLGENIRWFAANGVTGVYMVTMPDAFSSLCARCCSHGFSTSESIHHLILELLMNRILNFRMSMMARILKSEILILLTSGRGADESRRDLLRPGRAQELCHGADAVGPGARPAAAQRRLPPLLL